MSINRPDYAGRGREALSKIFDGIVAEVAGQPSAKAEAIANTDAHTSNAGLPTYSELVEALRRLSDCYDRYSGTGRRHEPPAVNATSLLSRIPS